MDNSHHYPDENRRKGYKKYLKITGIFAVLIGVFWFGLAVGQGKIVFGPDSVFRESVQQDDLEELDYRGVDELYRALAQSYNGQLDKEKLETGIKEGLVEAVGDPYTEYLTEEENQDFNEQLNGSFEGIGAELGKEDESIVIISPIEGFPAKKAGLRAGDVVAEIDGESALDISITEAVKKIRGPKGTEVKLTVVRDGETKEITITRDTISIPSVETEFEDGMGIISISRFGDDTAELVSQAADELVEKNAKGAILDLRGNPGGKLDAAIEVAEVWLNSGDKILEERRGGTLVRSYEARNQGQLSSMPTAVLINGGSASGSEIVAGALKDNNKAILIGEETFGKGSVQELRDLELSGVLKVTIAKWHTPSGRNIDEDGIQPDREIKLTEKDIEAKRDRQLNAAKKYIDNQ